MRWRICHIISSYVHALFPPPRGIVRVCVFLFIYTSKQHVNMKTKTRTGRSVGCWLSTRVTTKAARRPTRRRRLGSCCQESLASAKQHLTCWGCFFGSVVGWCEGGFGYWGCRSSISLASRHTHAPPTRSNTQPNTSNETCLDRLGLRVRRHHRQQHAAAVQLPQHAPLHGAAGAQADLI